MPNRNTIVVPCSVKRRLNVSAGTTVRPGHASCTRISAASMPAMTRNTRPVTTYMMPRRLWSTVTTQSWRIARTPDDSDAGAISRGTGTACGTLLMASPQCHEVRDELVELGVVELHRRHEGSGLERARILDPRTKVFGRVARGAGAKRGAAHQVSQVRAEHAVALRSAHRMAVDTC